MRYEFQRLLLKLTRNRRIVCRRHTEKVFIADGINEICACITTPSHLTIRHKPPFRGWLIHLLVYFFPICSTPCKAGNSQLHTFSQCISYALLLIWTQTWTKLQMMQNYVNDACMRTNERSSSKWVNLFSRKLQSSNRNIQYCWNNVSQCKHTQNPHILIALHCEKCACNMSTTSTFWQLLLKGKSAQRKIR